MLGEVYTVLRGFESQFQCASGNSTGAHSHANHFIFIDKIDADYFAIFSHKMYKLVRHIPAEFLIQ